MYRDGERRFSVRKNFDMNKLLSVVVSPYCLDD